MPVRALPPKPSLEHLKYQAKDLLKEHRLRSLGAAQRIREFHPRFTGASDAEIFDSKIRLSDAQLAIARESGFVSWARLKRHIQTPSFYNQLNRAHHERIEDAVLRRGVELLDGGDVEGLRAHLRQHPGLVRQHAALEGGNYFQNPTLLGFVAENPTRHGKLPSNIVEAARVILEAGVEQSARNEALKLIATSSVARECGVQVALIDLLCDYGADPNSAIHAALQGGPEGVNALIRRGARIDLPVVAALGRVFDAQRLLPQAASNERHLAFALASQFGQVEIVRLLLDAGEGVNRYNPVGCHSHSTPLHQAAWAGHMEVVRLLVERGARVDMKDVLWHGTAADWARRVGDAEIEAFLRGKEDDRKK